MIKNLVKVYVNKFNPLEKQRNLFPSVAKKISQEH